MSRLAAALLHQYVLFTTLSEVTRPEPRRGGGSGLRRISLQKRWTRLRAGAGCEMQSEVAAGDRDASSNGVMGWKRPVFMLAPT